MSIDRSQGNGILVLEESTMKPRSFRFKKTAPALAYVFECVHEGFECHIKPWTDSVTVTVEPTPYVKNDYRLHPEKYGLEAEEL